MTGPSQEALDLAQAMAGCNGRGRAAAVALIDAALAKARADAWDEGLRAGEKYERAKWHWSAGSLSRAVNGLKERPIEPHNPHRNNTAIEHVNTPEEHQHE